MPSIWFCVSVFTLFPLRVTIIWLRFSPCVSIFRVPVSPVRSQWRHYPHVHNNNSWKKTFARHAWPDKQNTSNMTTALQISIQQWDRCFTKTSPKRKYWNWEQLPQTEYHRIARLSCPLRSTRCRRARSDVHPGFLFSVFQHINGEDVDEDALHKVQDSEQLIQGDKCHSAKTWTRTNMPLNKIPICQLEPHTLLK